MAVGFSAGLGAFLKGKGGFDDLLRGENPILVLGAYSNALLWCALGLWV